MTGNFAIIDIQRCCVLYKHDKDQLLRDLCYIELPIDHAYELIGLAYSTELDFLDKKQLWQLGASLKVPPFLLETDCKSTTLAALHKLHTTKAREVEADLQAEWIRKNNPDNLIRYKYAYGDIVPGYAEYDWLPPAMVCDEYEEKPKRGRRKFEGSVKHQIFVFMDNLYERMGKPSEAAPMKALCGMGRQRLVSERGFNNHTVSQAITDWKKRIEL